jgi:hypothetical protein
LGNIPDIKYNSNVVSYRSRKQALRLDFGVVIIHYQLVGN